MTGHNGQHVGERLRSRKAIGIWKKIALERLRCGVEVADHAVVLACRVKKSSASGQAGSFELGRNVPQIKTLGNHYRVDGDIAARKAVIDLERIGWVIEQVFACLKRAQPKVMERQESVFATDRAGIAQFGRDSTG